jgi:hypothetical protein
MSASTSNQQIVVEPLPIQTTPVELADKAKKIDKTKKLADKAEKNHKTKKIEEKVKNAQKKMKT